MINVPSHKRRTPRRTGRWRADSTPCYICAEPIREERIKHMLHIHCGGGVAVTEAEAKALNASGEEGGDMGCFPIGPDCLRQHPELKPYVIRWEQQGP